MKRVQSYISRVPAQELVRAVAGFFVEGFLFY